MIANDLSSNLTNANHVVFVSPLLVATQHAYEQSMEQSIGRVRRYGQTKPVYVHRFVTLDTMDVNLLEERESKVLFEKRTVDTNLRTDIVDYELVENASLKQASLNRVVKTVIANGDKEQYHAPEDLSRDATMDSYLTRAGRDGHLDRDYVLQQNMTTDQNDD